MTDATALRPMTAIAVCIPFRFPKTENKRPKAAVYICSPFRGDEKTNIRKARRYCRFAYEQGYIPIAPHLYFPQFLFDSEPKERADALAWGLQILKACRELWVFGDRISEGMKAEIEEAIRLGLRIRHFGTMEEV
jgi:hypothetical protein